MSSSSSTTQSEARNARAVLKWLDEITSVTDRVYLQGGFEAYSTWEEVKPYMLPETLLSMESSYLRADSVADDITDLRLSSSEHGSVGSISSFGRRSISPASPWTSPAANGLSPVQPPKVLAPIGTGRPGHSKNPSTVSATAVTTAEEEIGEEPYERNGDVAASLRPFFNHIIWRIHHEQNSEVPIESFILVTGDSAKQQVAQRFGVRAKRLEQLKDIVSKENKSFQEKMAQWKKENSVGGILPVQPPMMSNTEHMKSSALSDDEDEVILKRSPPKALQAVGKNTKVLDPDAFSRRPDLGLRQQRPVSRQSNGSGFGNENSGQRGSPRNRPSRPYTRGKNTRGTSNGNVAASLADDAKKASVSYAGLTQPIDPDSFSRPSPKTKRGGLRGGKGKLWEPS